MLQEKTNLPVEGMETKKIDVEELAKILQQLPEPARVRILHMVEDVGIMWDKLDVSRAG